MKTVAIVQARMGSVRFPGKVLQPVCGTPLIGLLLERLGRSRHIDQIVLATSEDARNEPLASYVTGLGVTVFRGSEKNVLDRYYRAARSVAADVVIRITGDCPLIDPQLVDTVIEKFRASGADYVSNTSPPTYPDGLDTEVFRFSALETAWKQASTDFQKEHVTPFLRESPQFTKLTITHDTDVSTERWTVDEPADLDPVRRVFEHFHPRRDFDWLEVLAVRNSHPEWFMSNRHLTRNEGQELGTGQKLWKRAKQVIPGGSMLLSKRAEMFLPEKWPAYFSKAKGCRVWDLDGREYLDMTLMGIGTNTLGYGHPELLFVPGYAQSRVAVSFFRDINRARYPRDGLNQLGDTLNARVPFAIQCLHIDLLPCLDGSQHANDLFFAHLHGSAHGTFPRIRVRKGSVDEIFSA